MTQLTSRPVSRPRRSRDLFERRYVPAGEIFLIGLACFLLWLLLDARQLDNSARAAPLGVRRSVSLAILSPIARLNEALGLDRVVDGVNRALGRSSTTPGGLLAASPPASPPRALPVVRADGVPYADGRAPASVFSLGTGLQAGSKLTPTSAVPVLEQPTRVHKLVILDVGDSIGEDLGTGLADVIGSHVTLRLSLDAVGDTGLSNLAYYNWPVVLRRELASVHPGLVVAMFGGNDWQAFLVHGAPAQPGSPQWIAAYRSRIDAMMAAVRASGAVMVWVGLPVMGPASRLPAQMAPTLNALYAQEAARNHVLFYSSYRLFENAHGQYSEYLPTAAGNLVQVRDADGVHIAPPAGEDRLATAVVAAIEARWHVHL